MQVLPLLGWWLDRQGRPGTAVLRASAATYVVITAAVFGQALMGWPLVRL